MTFQESIMSIRCELEESDFDRNQLIAFQFTVMNIENSLLERGPICGLHDTPPFCVFFCRHLRAFDFCRSAVDRQTLVLWNSIHKG